MPSLSDAGRQAFSREATETDEGVLLRMVVCLSEMQSPVHGGGCETVLQRTSRDGRASQGTRTKVRDRGSRFRWCSTMGDVRPRVSGLPALR